MLVVSDGLNSAFGKHLNTWDLNEAGSTNVAAGNSGPAWLEVCEACHTRRAKDYIVLFSV